jgi:hypothetical protein
MYLPYLIVQSATFGEIQTPSGPSRHHALQDEGHSGEPHPFCLSPIVLLGRPLQNPRGFPRWDDYVNGGGAQPP